MVLSAQEFWTAVIAICLPILIYLLRDCAEEYLREDIGRTQWKWGDKARRCSGGAVWFPHEVGLIVTCLADLAILKALLS